MTIVTFIARANDEQHRETARIGDIEVGYVMDMESKSGAARPHWMATVPQEAARVLHVANSRGDARRELILRVAVYFDLMGPRFVDIARDVRSEALCVDDAA